MPLQKCPINEKAAESRTGSQLAVITYLLRVHLFRSADFGGGAETGLGRNDVTRRKILSHAFLPSFRAAKQPGRQAAVKFHRQP